MNSQLFVADPWPVMMQVAQTLRTKEKREAASAFLEQAQDFYKAAASASTTAAKPLLLYYAFLNTAKALIQIRDPSLTLDAAHHGLSEKLLPGGKELLDAYLDVSGPGAKPQVFDLLHKALTGACSLGPKKLSVPILMRQIVSGHRLFHAARASGSENFLAVGPIEFLHEQASRNI